MKILDLSAGKRNVWFQRLHPDTVYVDIRPEVAPTLVCDTQHLPFQPDVFDLIVFDPPHLQHGEHSNMGLYYGSFRAEEIRTMLHQTAAEAYRVAKSGCFLALKWNDHDVRLKRILELLEGWEPLFGHQVATRNKHRSSTYWVLCRKRPSGFQPESIAQQVLAFEQRDLRCLDEPVASE